MARQRTVVGFDVGRHSVKAVWVDIGRGQSSSAVTRSELLRLPSDPVERDAVLDPWMEQMNFGKYPCVIGVAGSQTMFQPVFQAEEDPRTPEQAAAMEVVRFNEMASEDMLHGFSSFSAPGHSKCQLLAMARPRVIGEVISFARSRELNIVDVVPTPVATFNGAGSVLEDGKGPYMLLNVGYRNTEMCIGVKGELMFARSFACGGQLFTESLAKTQDLSYSQAENTKVTKGSLLEKDSISADLRPVAAMWISEVKACLSVYTNLFPSEEARPTSIILCGGGSNLKGLAEYAEQELDSSVQCLDNIPGEGMTGEPATMVTAYGLCLLGDETLSDLTRISLLPPSVRDELMFRKQKPFWIAAAVTAALVLATSVIGGRRDISFNTKKNMLQRSELREKEDLKIEIEQIKAKQDHIRSLAAPIHKLVSAAPIMRDVVSLVARSVGDRDWITMICDSESYFRGDAVWTQGGVEEAVAKGRLPEAAKKKKKQEKVVKEGKDVSPVFEEIIVEGFTRTKSLATVQELIAKLAEADYVESTDLLGDEMIIRDEAEDEKAATINARRFVIRVRVKDRSKEVDQ